MSTLYDVYVHTAGQDAQLIAVCRSLPKAKSALDMWLAESSYSVQHATIHKRDFVLRNVAGAMATYGNREGSIVYRLRVS